jgi:hypothetical protein
MLLYYEDMPGGVFMARFRSFVTSLTTLRVLLSAQMLTLVTPWHERAKRSLGSEWRIPGV